MTVEHLDSFNFDPEAGPDLGNSEDLDLDLDLDLVPIVDLEEVQISSIDQLVDTLEEDDSEDDQKMEDHYIKLLASDFRRAKRAKQDREDRASIRKHFEVLSALSARVQIEHSIDVADNDDLCRPSDSFRCRDSNLRTLRKARKTLQELLDINRELKKERREVKDKLKVRKTSAKHPKKTRNTTKPSTPKKQLYPEPNYGFNNMYNSHYPVPSPCQQYPPTPIGRVGSLPYPMTKNYPLPSKMYLNTPSKIHPQATYSSYITPTKSLHNLADSSNGVNCLSVTRRDTVKPCHVISM